MKNFDNHFALCIFHFAFCLLINCATHFKPIPVPTLSKERSAVKEKLKCLCTDETETRFVFGLAGNCEIIRKVLHIKSAIKRRTDLRHYVCLWRRHKGLTCRLISQFATHGCELKHVLIRVNCMWIGSTSDDFNCETWRRVDAASAQLELRLMSTKDLKENLCCRENKSQTSFEVKRVVNFPPINLNDFEISSTNLCNFLQLQAVGCLLKLRKIGAKG